MGPAAGVWMNDPHAAGVLLIDTTLHTIITLLTFLLQFAGMIARNVYRFACKPLRDFAFFLQFPLMPILLQIKVIYTIFRLVSYQINLNGPTR